MRIRIEIDSGYFAGKFQSILSWNYIEKRSFLIVPEHLKSPRISRLCFVIILLLPFLIACNTFVWEASAQDVRLVQPLSASVLRSRSSLTADGDHRGRSVKRRVCPNIWNARLYNSPTGNCTNRSKNNRNRSNSNVSNRRARNVVAMGHIYTPSNRSHNEYSLITLSQPVVHPSPHTDARSMLHATRPIRRSSPVSLQSFARHRNRRYINKAHYSHQRQVKRPLENKLRFEQYPIVDNDKLTELIKRGLGLRKLPDMKKANISQLEYSSKYMQYFERLRRSHVGDGEPFYGTGLAPATLQILSIVSNSFTEVLQRRGRHRRAPNRSRKSYNKSVGSDEKTKIHLHFPLAVNDAHLHYEKLVEANVRLMMLYNPALARNRKGATLGVGAAKDRAPFRHKGNCGGGIERTGSNNQRSRAPTPRSYALNLKVFQVLPMHKRRQLDARKIEFESSISRDDDETRSQWLEFDVTEAVRGWLNKTNQNLGIEIHCDKCERIGARILSTGHEMAQDQSQESHQHQQHEEREQDQDQQQQERSHQQQERKNSFYMAPVLNIIGHVGHTHREQGVQQIASLNHSNYWQHSQPNRSKQRWPNSCYKARQRCCRHQLDVAFKDIKGFEFIIYPKIFDAGFCLGRCPPRHNPAHHHALLQSLIWQQDHSRVPRPCCAPSRLMELEILHVDEEHSDKLKISTWKDMQVVECACS